MITMMTVEHIKRCNPVTRCGPSFHCSFSVNGLSVKSLKSLWPSASSSKGHLENGGVGEVAEVANPGNPFRQLIKEELVGFWANGCRQRKSIATAKWLCLQVVHGDTHQCERGNQGPSAERRQQRTLHKIEKR